jgi:DnaK suppressor protein
MPTSSTKNGKKKSLNSLKNLLLAKQQELRDRIEQRRNEILVEHDPDDEGALAVHNATKDLALSNMEREVRTLAEIELSLGRMDSGEYGYCGSCGEEIPEARLLALPWTRLCVNCAGGGIHAEKRRQSPSNNSFELEESLLARSGASRRR